MAVRDHVRQMTTNRATYQRALSYRDAALKAARAGDFIAFGCAIMHDPTWLPGERSQPDEQRQIMADYLARNEGQA